MGQSKHSSEPWFQFGFNIHNKKGAIAQCIESTIDGKFNYADSERIVVCVNAMAGVDDPQKLRDEYELDAISIIGLKSTLKDKEREISELRLKLAEKENETIEFNEQEFWTQVYISCVGSSNTVNPATPKRWADAALIDFKKTFNK